MKRVVVNAPARLHFGLLGAPVGKGGRIGSLGLTVEEPRLVLEAEPAERVEAEGPQAERVRAAAEVFRDKVKLAAGARFTVREAIPEHVGLGSGTQIALATAAALARLHSIPGEVAEWCAALGRGRRSGIGAHAFRLGGFLLDAGRAEGGPPPPPLVFRQPFPEEWAVLLVLPRSGRGVSGDEEERVFENLPPPPEALMERLSGIVLMRLLPALLERDLASFSAALEAIQGGVGRCFEAVQGDLYHPMSLPLVRWLRGAGAQGVGQSSWGPAVYALAADPGAAQALARRLREAGPASAPLDIRILRARNHGASIQESP